MDILSGLNPQQRQAVEYRNGPLLILAGAGSGKTRVLTYRAAYFIREGLVKPSEVLLLTFTNKAAGEMKDRMNQLLGAKDKKSNGLFAGTFHSFCCRVLRTDGHHIGYNPQFVIYDSDDQENLIRSVLLDMGLTAKEFKPSSVLYYIENAKNSFQTPEMMLGSAHGFWESRVAKIYAQYQKKLKAFQALDFNDLLYQTVELFVNNPEVLRKYQEQYRFILVDEYQDTNQIQYQLTKLLSLAHRQITAVGDAAQAIYGWRGADYRNLTAFTTDFNNALVINLEENYRSTQVILEAANHVISKNTSHPVLKLFTSKTSNNLIKSFQSDSEVGEAEFVAEKIRFLTGDVGLRFQDIAVLYRMNAQSRVIEEAFLKYGIPYVLIGGLRFYDRSEIKDILAMLRFANNQKDELSYARVEKALGKRRLATFDVLIKNIDPKTNTSLEILENLVVNSGYLHKFDTREEDDQKKIENIKELKSVASNFPTLNDFLENVALVQQEYSEQEKNKKNENRAGVRLMTLHSSKGLEFEAVFLVGFEEGLLPHSRSMIEDADIEEERRLAYVGITRAREFLFISFANRRLFFGKSSLNEPSRFFYDIPDSLIEHLESLNIIHDLRPKNKSTDSDYYYDPDIY